MLILRTPKGWTGPKELDGLPVEGTFRAHQVPIKDAGTNNEHLKLLDGWLRSYKVDELFDEEGRVRKEVRAILPERKMRIGLNRRTVGKGVEFSKDLVLPAVESFGVKVESEKRGQAVASNTWELGVYLTGVIENNPKSFRIFSPDELESNKLHAVFKKTHRNYQWPVDAKAKVTDLSNKGGRVIEMLSEHTLQGFMQGYVLTHRFAIFPSYEAFLGYEESSFNFERMFVYLHLVQVSSRR
jgi:xylulose-5-phosphate/fructose-6-phosphate phosphoketolase